MSSNLQRLQQIFRNVLEDQELEISSSFSISDHSGWDSVATVQIMLATEEEFGCRLPVEAVAGLKTVADIIKHLPVEAKVESSMKASPIPYDEMPASGKTDAATAPVSGQRAEALLTKICMGSKSAVLDELFADLRLAIQIRTDFNFLLRAARALDKLAANGTVPKGTIGIKIALLGSTTTEFVTPLLKLACFRDGFWAQIYAAPFGAFRQEILDAGSTLYKFAPDFVLLAVNWRDAHLPPFSEDPEATIGRIVSEFGELLEMLVLRARCTVIAHNFDLPAFDPTGHLGTADPRGRPSVLRNINARLQSAAPTGVIVMDFDGISSDFGRDRWCSPEMWHLAKQHPSADALPLLVDHYLAIIRARLGRSKKVLVLDLDNTLWGGVVGEDGVSGIRIGPPSAEGEAYAAFQHYALELKLRGVLLAVCSKNHENDALQPFLEHEGMILRQTDFVAFVANWNDKSTNLRKLARDLNLGLDSFVFVDDNPVEREEVRLQLPEVAVVELSPDISGFVRALHNGRHFEALTLSEEDFKRHESYQLNALRNDLKASAASLDAFLEGLEMRVHCGAIADNVFDRVVQLLGKTNQFNLTSRRHSAEAVRDMMRDSRVWTHYFRLVDRFGDNGIVGLAITRESEPYQWEIDTLLMSCRVIGRRLEDFMVSTVLVAAQAAGCKRVRGLYLPTAKNSMAADFYSRVGFTEYPASENAVGKTYFWDLTSKPPFSMPIFTVTELQLAPASACC